MILCHTVTAALITYYNVCLFIASRITTTSPLMRQSRLGTPRRQGLAEFLQENFQAQTVFFRGKQENMTRQKWSLFGWFTWVYL